MTTTTETQFKVGDKVAVDMDEPDYTWHGTEGIVKEVRGTRSARVEVTKVGTNHKNLLGKPLKVGDVHTLTALTVIPSFTFADIQVGDTIRRTQTFTGGATEVREGKVDHVKSWYVSAEGDNFIMAYDTDDKPEVTLELLNRPEPEPVKADWELAKTGDRLVVKNGKGITRVLTKQVDGLWDCLVIRSYGSGTGITRPDDEVKGQLNNSAFSEDGSYEFFPAS